jgi:DNA polymerase III epsilon subunit-like protein
MKYLFSLDLETTGFCPIRNDVISIGLIVLDSQLKEIESIYLKVRPDHYAWMSDDNVATHVHGFKLSEMLFFEERRSVIVKLMNFLKPFKHEINLPRPLFYHATNAFDYLFLEWFFRKENLQYSFWKIFNHQSSHSTVLLTRSLGFEGNKLNQWADRLSVSFNHHNALDDARMCAKILQYILKNNFNNDVENLFFHLSKVKDNDLQKVQEKEKPSGFFNL